MSESEAIARAREGDRSAFATLVSLHQETAFRAAFLILRDAAAAEDIVQEAFIRAFRQIQSFRTGEPFRPWLVRIVRNLALNEARSRKRRTSLLERFRGVTLLSHEPSPEETYTLTEKSAAVLAAISRLDSQDRALIEMRYFLDMNERELAAAFGRPPGTIKSRLHRAIGRMRLVIEKEFPELWRSIE